MDITVHVGVHRTGSASLHHWLEWQRDALSARGVALWLPGPRQAAALAEADGPEADRGAPARVVASIGRLERAGVSRLVVSSPALSGSGRACLIKPRLFPDFSANMTALSQTMGPKVTRLCMAIRSYEGFWGSLLTSSVMGGGGLPDNATLDRIVTQPRRWRTIVDEAAAAFPQADIVVWPFERLVARPDRQIDLLTGRTMKGPGQPGTTPWFGRSPDRDELRHRLRERGGDWQAIPMGDGRWMPFDISQIATMRDQYSADLAWLRAGAGGLATLDEGFATASATDQVPVAI